MIECWAFQEDLNRISRRRVTTLKICYNDKRVPSFDTFHSCSRYCGVMAIDSLANSSGGSIHCILVLDTAVAINLLIHVEPKIYCPTFHIMVLMLDQMHCIEHFHETKSYLSHPVWAPITGINLQPFSFNTFTEANLDKSQIFGAESRKFFTQKLPVVHKKSLYNKRSYGIQACRRYTIQINLPVTFLQVMQLLPQTCYFPLPKLAKRAR
uniref:Uncharacterized protein n=1 Tax=Solanum lycopersicum TaxID=4081 RepID=A0A3Q7ERB5_SOLLC